MFNISLYFSLLGLLLQTLPAISTTTSKYGTITQTQNDSVLEVTFFNNSTNVNLYDNKVQSDLYDLVTQLQNQSSTKVVVFRSGNPNFFFSIFDLLATRPGEFILSCCTISFRNYDNG